MKIAGIVNLGVGAGPGSPYLCGLIPGFIGVGMLVYALFLADPVL